MRRYFPADYWSPRWPTTDGVIPAACFWPLLEDLWRVQAMEQISTARAIGLALSGDTPKAQRIRQTTFDLAYPEG